MTALNCLVAGVGGQGTLLASDILAEVGMQAGYDVKKSDVLGLAVRGGGVLSHVRWGKKLASPVVRTGEMDYMLALEPLEGLRGLPMLHPTGTIVCNTHRVMPVSVTSGDATYPTQDQIHSTLSVKAGALYFLDATEEAVQLGNVRVANIVMLGAFSALLDVDLAVWEQVVRSRVPEKRQEINVLAFRKGRELMEGRIDR